jgi:RNAse (barnase) inhibitor barstar
MIADIIDSRKIENRPEFQRRLKQHLNQINDVSGTSLLSPYTLTLGDEFQAVYGSFDTLFTDIVQIILGIYPVQLRFAFSYGPLTTDINPTAALEMDGPAFSDARELMKTMKSESTGTIQITATQLYNPDLVNVCLKLFGHTISTLSRNNITIVDRLMNGADTKSIAQTLGITPRAVNKAIARHSLDDLVELTRTLSWEFKERLQTHAGKEDRQ